MITASQIRAARAMLGWSQTDLADAARVSLPTIKRMEGDRGPGRSSAENVNAVRQALEGAGAAFIAPGSYQALGGPGVRLQVCVRPQEGSDYELGPRLLRVMGQHAGRAFVFFVRDASSSFPEDQPQDCKSFGCIATGGGVPLVIDSPHLPFQRGRAIIVVRMLLLARDNGIPLFLPGTVPDTRKLSDWDAFSMLSQRPGRPLDDPRILLDEVPIWRRELDAWRDDPGYHRQEVGDLFRLYKMA